MNQPQHMSMQEILDQVRVIFLEYPESTVRIKVYEIEPKRKVKEVMDFDKDVMIASGTNFCVEVRHSIFNNIHSDMQHTVELLTTGDDDLDEFYYSRNR